MATAAGTRAAPKTCPAFKRLSYNAADLLGFELADAGSRRVATANENT